MWASFRSYFMVIKMKSQLSDDGNVPNIDYGVCHVFVKPAVVVEGTGFEPV
jgi:hypothetical protein